MQTPGSSTNVTPNLATVETLESRRHLSTTLLPSCIDASAATAATTAVRVASGATSNARVLSPGKVTATPVDLTPYIVGIVKRNINGKYIVPEVIIRNAGPATAKGTLRISIEFSYYYSGAYPRLFRTVNTAINIKSGGSKTVRIGGYIPKSFPTFDYHMIAVINANKKIPETNYANDTLVTGGYFYLA